MVIKIPFLYLYRFFFVVATIFASFSNGSELAKIRQEGGVHVTSSTLKWVAGKGHHIPSHSVPVSEDDPSKVWCRIKQHGTYAAGALKDGVCTVPFINAVHMVKDNFEVLVSLNGSARVLRIEWDKYKAAPPNAIAPEHRCVLAMVEEDGQTYAGFLKPRDRRAFLVKDDKVIKVDSALVLVEDEPLRYDLRNIRLDHARTEISPDEIELTSITLMNPGEAQERIVEPATVTVRHLVYWGRVKGTLAGRNALVVTPEGEHRHLVWGDQNELDRAHQLLLEADLPPGTGCNARVLATIRKTEAPYTGKLIAVYADGGRLERTIQGLHMDQRLIELRAVYSSPYYLHNKTMLDVPGISHVIYVSTTTTTTTTTSTTTTTTPTPVQLNDQPEAESVAEIPQRGSLSREIGNFFSNSGIKSSISAFALLIPCIQAFRQLF